MACAAIQSKLETASFSVFRGWVYAHFPFKIFARQRVFLQHFLVCSLKDDFASSTTCKWAYIDDVVGILHHLAVVFHHKHGVSSISKCLKRMDELDIVALMQADAGFVEYVKYAYKLAANLCCKADALTFATGKAHRGTRKRQVIEADIKQEPQSRLDFLSDFLCNSLLAFAHSAVQTFQPFVELTQFQSRDFCDVLAVEQEVKTLFLQALPFAFGTFAGSAELFSPSLSCSSNFCILHLLNVLDQSVELRIDIICGLSLAGRYSNAFRTAFQYLINRFFRNLAKRCVCRTIVLLEHSFHLPEYHGLLCFAKRSEASIAKRKARVGDNLVPVDDMNEAQAFATWASTLRTIE